MTQRLRDPSVRLVTLTGLGGVGKTRLAIEVARQLAEVYADGVCFAALSSVSDGSMVSSVIGRSVGIHVTGAEQASAEVAEWLRTRQLLLVLQLRAPARCRDSGFGAAVDVPGPDRTCHQQNATPSRRRTGSAANAVGPAEGGAHLCAGRPGGQRRSHTVRNTRTGGPTAFCCRPRMQRRLPPSAVASRGSRSHSSSPQCAFVRFPRPPCCADWSVVCRC